jgi:glycosyltransferase involved in cell wall biosynthesis
MRVLWLSWKDIANPLAGGAELVSSELAKRLVRDGHELILLTAAFPNAKPELTVDGYRVIRRGNRFTVYLRAFMYVRKHLSDWPDLVIDEVNTLPFFAKYYVRAPNILFVHMLCRKIWFYQIAFPLSVIGFLLEPLYLRLLADRPVITVSESTKADLVRYGFKPDNVSIISEGIKLRPLKDLKKIRKFKWPTVLSLGSIRPMKRTIDQIRAFELAKQSVPGLKMKIAGGIEGRYGRRVVEAARRSPYGSDIEIFGPVSDRNKAALMQHSHLILVTSIKEGWGLIVTEAASQGTPAIVYDADGLRDSVLDGETGLITHSNNPQYLAYKIVEALSDQSLYGHLQKRAWVWSKEINFDNSYKQFRAVVG